MTLTTRLLRPAYKQIDIIHQAAISFVRQVKWEVLSYVDAAVLQVARRVTGSNLTHFYDFKAFMKI